MMPHYARVILRRALLGALLAVAAFNTLDVHFMSGRFALAGLPIFWALWGSWVALFFVPWPKERQP